MKPIKYLLPKQWYQRKDVVSIAKNLLGMEVCSRVDGKITAGIIVETEAYKAPEDKASHAYLMKRNGKNSSMYLAGGHAYVYVCYGLHQMFNVVTNSAEVPHAVLIRAIEPVIGTDIMQKRRNKDSFTYELTNGPGKVGEALGISTKLDGIKLYEANSFISIYQSNQKVNYDIVIGPRVGLSKFTEESAHLPFRFKIKDNRWTSKPNEVQYPW